MARNNDLDETYDMASSSPFLHSPTVADDEYEPQMSETNQASPPAWTPHITQTSGNDFSSSVEEDEEYPEEIKQLGLTLLEKYKEAQKYIIECVRNLITAYRIHEKTERSATRARDHYLDPVEDLAGDTQPQGTDVNFRLVKVTGGIPYLL